MTTPPTPSNEDSFTFDGTEFGNKTITETVRTGWSLEHRLHRHHGDRPGTGITVNVHPGDTSSAPSPTRRTRP